MEGTLAEIRMFGGNFNPRGWMFCNGQLLSIAQWTAVFALVGTVYGGDGQVTFGLPDLRGRIPLGTGNGAGLSPVVLGEMAGSPTQTLALSQLPSHNHLVSGSITMQVNNDSKGLTDDATNARFGLPATPNIFSSATDALVSMAPMSHTLTTGFMGSNTPVSTTPPYLGINFIICVEGIFPSRN